MKGHAPTQQYSLGANMQAPVRRSLLRRLSRMRPKGSKSKGRTVYANTVDDIIRSLKDATDGNVCCLPAFGYTVMDDRTGTRVLLCHNVEILKVLPNGVIAEAHIDVEDLGNGKYGYITSDGKAITLTKKTIQYIEMCQEAVSSKLSQQ